MQLKRLVLTAMAGTAMAQMMNDLAAVLANQTELSNLTSLLGAFPGVTGMLTQLSNITLLAPSNAAIAEFINATGVTDLTTERDLVRAILSYHVLNGSYPSFENTSFVPTALGKGMYANVTGGQVVEAIGSSGNVTFFSGLTSNSTVTSSVNFTGGVIHIIDRLLVLPQNASSTSIAFNLTAAVGAITQLNLTELVDTAEDLTLFIPNNEAFQSIGSALPNLTTAQLSEILSYHAVQGPVAYSTTLMNGTSVATLQGSNVTITINGTDVYVNNARVIVPDILISNGVIHIIDEVLNPNNTAAMKGGSSFEGAGNSTDVPFTSGVPTPTSAIATASVTGAKSSAAGGATSNPGWIAAHPTGAMAPLALFGGAAVLMNL